MPLQSQVIPICVTQNSCFFGIFWEKMLSHGQTVHFLPIVLYIFRKLCIWGFRKSGWNSIFDILWSVRFLVTGMDWILPSFLHCVLDCFENWFSLRLKGGCLRLLPSSWTVSQWGFSLKGAIVMINWLVFEWVKRGFMFFYPRRSNILPLSFSR